MKWISLVPLISLLGTEACQSETQFRGASTRRPPDPVIGCSIFPEKISPGETATIAVSSSYRQGDLFQRVVGDEALDDVLLKSEDDSYVREDGAANQLAPASAGTWTVELRDQQDGDVVASCAVVVEVPAVECKDEEKSIGARLAFVIDNSFSHVDTDCAEYDREVFARERRIVCTQQTNREKAVMSAFDILADFSAQRDDAGEAQSEFGVAYFPTRQDHINGYRITTDQWLPTLGDQRQTTLEALAFSRQPLGYTPYGAGIRAAIEMFSKIDVASDHRKNVAVLVTDGEPTDRNPGETIALAKRLHEMGVEVISVTVTSGQSLQRRLTEHRRYLEQENQRWLVSSQRRPWYDNSTYDSLDAYLSALIGSTGQASLTTQITSPVDPACVDQADRICSRKIVAVESTDELQNVFSEIVRSSTTCN